MFPYKPNRAFFAKYSMWQQYNRLVSFFLSILVYIYYFNIIDINFYHEHDPFYFYFYLINFNNYPYLFKYSIKHDIK